ncbi:MAG TPA: bifunctional UDP-N-acetylglucosamine diphosphorylase/glucosamine-1-phosphate N-acetyltransferase GlmU [Bacilli bacterium]
MPSTIAIVLAAGKGKRMKSKLYKVLHPVCGQPMLGHVIAAVQAVQPDKTIVVVGHGADKVRSFLGEQIETVLQEEQLGTGHAVLMTKPLLHKLQGTTLVLYGDTPLIRPETIERLIALHRQSNAAVTLLTAMIDEPHGYGRIVRDAADAIVAVVEEKDCTPEQKQIKEVNTGIYCFDNRKLFAALGQIRNDNAQQEYYLTDVIQVLQQQGEKIAACVLDDPTEAAGVNDRVALAEVEKLLRMRIIRQHMLNGVTIVDPSSTYIDAGVRVGQDTVLLPGTTLYGTTSIGEDCLIGPHSEIRDSMIGNGVHIKHSVLDQAKIGDKTTVGPFAYLRPGAKIGAGARIGDFVEIKNAAVGEGSKIPHLSYVGDAIIGNGVNFGCGAITVNYDGYHKHLTEVGDNAFVGSNVNLIAPVKIGSGAYVVAGSTITHDVGENDLAIARERQITKPEYANVLRARIKERTVNSRDEKQK